MKYFNRFKYIIPKMKSNVKPFWKKSGKNGRFEGSFRNPLEIRLERRRNREVSFAILIPGVILLHSKEKGRAVPVLFPGGPGMVFRAVLSGRDIARILFSEESRDAAEMVFEMVFDVFFTWSWRGHECVQRSGVAA